MNSQASSYPKQCLLTVRPRNAEPPRFTSDFDIIVTCSGANTLSLDKQECLETGHRATARSIRNTRLAVNRIKVTPELREGV